MVAHATRNFRPNPIFLRREVICFLASRLPSRIDASYQGREEIIPFLVIASVSGISKKYSLPEQGGGGLSRDAQPFSNGDAADSLNMMQITFT